MRLATAFHAESAYAHLPLALAKVDDLVVRALNDPNRVCFVWAVRPDDHIEGYLMAVCHEHYFAYTQTITDIGFYIAPKHRSILAARQMILALERWAFHVKHAADISLGVSSGIADERVIRFYRKLGYARGFAGCIKSR